jgi:hypothetical protein
MFEVLIGLYMMWVVWLVASTVDIVDVITGGRRRKRVKVNRG